MFKKNDDHRQRRMFTAVDQLPESAQKRLKQSWAHYFYTDFFCKLDEDIFSVMYSDKNSRPNTPVNILIGFETLKSGFGWSDEELYNHFLFDLQVRYALGLHDFDEEYFDLRTIYHFRRALCDYEKEHDVNLIQQATERITDAQIEKFKLKTGLQRMDSTQIQSNIQKMSRIQLLVEIIHRLHRILTLKDQKDYEKFFAPYIKENALHYCYRLKRDETNSVLEHIGNDLAYLTKEFELGYNSFEAFNDLVRVFNEHYKFEEESLIVKTGKELRSGTLQSPDDKKATFRRKNGEVAKGYVANITETCDPDNQLQLITTVSVNPNNVDDQVLMSNDLEGLAERTNIEEILTDAGYIGTTAHDSIAKHGLTHSVTAIKGRKNNNEKLGFKDFKLTLSSEGIFESIECPNGVIGKVKYGKQGRYSAGFDSNICFDCPLKDKCIVTKLKKKELCILRFTDDNIRVALQWKQFKGNKKALNMRASVESTVRSVIHPFGGHLCKMPVRGKQRIKTMTILSATMVNIRRITKYLSLNNEVESLIFAGN